MISSHDSPFLFALAIGPAMFLAVLLHEIGHVIAARCVGIDVAAWGVGYRSPWYFRRLGSSVFYLGRPLTGGMMIPFSRKLEREPFKEFIMVLGGPLASLFGLLAGIAGAWWLQGYALIYAWTYVSAIYVLLSLVPLTFRSKSFTFLNDAKRLIHILRKGRAFATTPIGPALSSAQSVAMLMSSIECEKGRSDSYASIAMLQSTLGDSSAAVQSLAEATKSAARGPLSYLACVMIAVAENSDDTPAKIASAREQFNGDASVEFLIDLLHEQWLFLRDCGRPEEMQQLRHRALAASRKDWLCWID